MIMEKQSTDRKVQNSTPVVNFPDPLPGRRLSPEESEALFQELRGKVSAQFIKHDPKTRQAANPDDNQRGGR
jgi:hypothetical protein